MKAIGGWPVPRNGHRRPAWSSRAHPAGRDNSGPRNGNDRRHPACPAPARRAGPAGRHRHQGRHQQRTSCLVFLERRSGPPGAAAPEPLDWTYHPGPGPFSPGVEHRSSPEPSFHKPETTGLESDPARIEAHRLFRKLRMGEPLTPKKERPPKAGATQLSAYSDFLPPHCEAIGGGRCHSEVSPEATRAVTDGGNQFKPPYFPAPPERTGSPRHPRDGAPPCPSCGPD